MKSRFLTRLFSTAELPPSVLSAAIDTYSPLYLAEFIQNESLGALSRPLIDTLLENGDDNSVIALIRTRNIHVLSHLTTRPGLLPDTILFAVVDVWNLADELATQLGTHANTKSMVDYLLVAAEHINGCPGWGATTSLRQPPPRRNVAVPRSTPQEALSQSLATLGGTSEGLEFISETLTKELGTGSNTSSLRSWRNFFGLAQNDPDVPLKKVLRSSKILALAE